MDYGRPGTKAARLRRAVHELLLDHQAADELPTSNRFLFYELVQRAELDKSQTRQRGRGADQDLSDASKWLRDRGVVPWSWIVDETRGLTAYRYADTVAEYVAESVKAARINCWSGAEPPLIVCESRTFGGVLARTLAPEYLCPVTATNGQVGGFLHTNVAPVLSGNDRPVLYVGDLDKQGGDIEANTCRVLVQATEREIEWRRVALTAEQAAEHDLPAIPKVDRRHRPPRIGEATEVEALGQGTVTALVREALDALLPEPLDTIRAREEQQRADALARLRRQVL
jgi:hypothetical protein